MLQYVGTVLYVWGFMAVTVGPYLWQPYTGKGPPGTYRVVAEPQKVQDRLVPRVVRVKTVKFHRLQEPR